MHARMCPLYSRELVVKQDNTRTLRSNTNVSHTYLKGFGDRGFFAITFDWDLSC